MVFALSTERLALEDLNDSDLDAVRRMARDPAIMKYISIWLERGSESPASCATQSKKRPSGPAGLHPCSPDTRSRDFARLCAP